MGWSCTRIFALKVAVLCVRLIKNRPLPDANKRIGYMSAHAGHRGNLLARLALAGPARAAGG